MEMQACRLGLSAGAKYVRYNYNPVPYHISREGFIMFYLFYRNILYDVVCKHPETGEGERSIYQYFQHTQDSAPVDE